MKILFIAVPIGAGHIKAANAIKRAIEVLNKETETRFEDCFKWVSPLYGLVYKKIYEFGQRHSYRLLKLFYKGSGVKSGSSKLLYIFHKKTACRFKNLLKEFRPNYILCSHFSPAYYAALYKKEYDYKIGVVVTDYYVHPHWVNNEIDHYFIPHESLIEQILSYGAQREKIHPLGIPIDPMYEGYIDKESARKRFNISEKRISAVIMGSRVFGGEWFELVQEMIDFDIDLLVLCGENIAVKKKIEGLKGKANLVTYGMVERIYELIAVCDILITKAGGITTTEASKVGPCLLLANSIPGLEDKNEEFFIGHHAALRLTKKNAKTAMAYLLTNSTEMAKMRNNLKNLSKKDTALNIAKVLKGINGKR